MCMSSLLGGGEHLQQFLGAPLQQPVNQGLQQRQLRGRGEKANGNFSTVRDFVLSLNPQNFQNSKCVAESSP